MDYATLNIILFKCFLLCVILFGFWIKNVHERNASYSYGNAFFEHIMSHKYISGSIDIKQHRILSELRMWSTNSQSPDDCQRKCICKSYLYIMDFYLLNLFKPSFLQVLDSLEYMKWKHYLFSAHLSFIYKSGILFSSINW